MILITLGFSASGEARAESLFSLFLCQPVGSKGQHSTRPKEGNRTFFTGIKYFLRHKDSKS